MILIDIIDSIRGILKRRKVTNMLCCEYSYEMDIAVKKEEAAEDKAEEIASNLLCLNKLSTEEISSCCSLSVEKVKELWLQKIL